MTIKIDLPAEHTVTKGPRDKSWTSAVSVDLGKLSPEIVARLAVHGLHQKIADAASGAETEAEATASMQKAVDAILAGEWTQRTGGGGVDEFTLVMRQIVRGAMKAKFGAKSPEWTEFTGRDDAAQNAKFQEVFDANEATFRPLVEARVAERAAERARKGKLAGSLDISL